MRWEKFLLQFHSFEYKSYLYTFSTLANNLHMHWEGSGWVCGSPLINANTGKVAKQSLPLSRHSPIEILFTSVLSMSHFAKKKREKQSKKVIRHTYGSIEPQTRVWYTLGFITFTPPDKGILCSFILFLVCNFCRVQLWWFHIWPKEKQIHSQTVDQLSLQTSSLPALSAYKLVLWNNYY